LVVRNGYARREGSDEGSLRSSAGRTDGSDRVYILDGEMRKIKISEETYETICEIVKSILE
jgi:hypothetical protein